MLRNIPNRVDFDDLKQFLEETQEGHYDFSSPSMFLQRFLQFFIESNNHNLDDIHAFASLLVELR